MRSFRELIKGEVDQALVRAFLARSVAAMGAVLLTVVVGRLYGPAGVGSFALAYSFLMGGGVLSRAGMDNTVMRYVGQDYASPYILTYFKWAAGVSLVISVVIGIVFWLASQSIEREFNSPYLSILMKSMAFALPPFALGFLLSGFFKGVRRPATACLLENGIVSLVAVLIVLLLHFSIGDIDFSIVAYSYATAAWIVLIIGIYQLICWKEAKIQVLSNYSGDNAVLVPFKKFMTTSRELFVTGFSGYLQAVLCIIIAGWFLPNTELGIFRSSQQVALLIGFVLIVINSVFPPRFANLFHNGKLQELNQTARKGAIIGVIFASPLTVVCLIFPDKVLAVFGPGFDDGSLMLRIMVIAQFFNVATGSVAFILNMTGHEKFMRNIALFCNSIGLCFLFVLIPMLGALGAAISVAFILIAQNAIALYFVWRKLGIWMLPYLSFSGLSKRVE